MLLSHLGDTLETESRELSASPGAEGEDRLQRAQGSSGVVDLFYIMTLVVVTRLDIFANIHGIVCKLYLNKLDLRTNKQQKRGLVKAKIKKTISEVHRQIA